MHKPEAVINTIYEALVGGVNQMKDNLSKFKPAAALITVLLGIALLASCTGQNNIEQNSERDRKSVV